MKHTAVGESASCGSGDAEEGHGSECLRKERADIIDRLDLEIFLLTQFSGDQL